LLSCYLVCLFFWSVYVFLFLLFFFFFSSRRRHTRSTRDWSSDVCSSDLVHVVVESQPPDDRSSSLVARRRHRSVSTRRPQTRKRPALTLASGQPGDQMHALLHRFGEPLSTLTVFIDAHHEVRHVVASRSPARGGSRPFSAEKLSADELPDQASEEHLLVCRGLVCGIERSTSRRSLSVPGFRLSKPRKRGRED